MSWRKATIEYNHISTRKILDAVNEFQRRFLIASASYDVKEVAVLEDLSTFKQRTLYFSPNSYSIPSLSELISEFPLEECDEPKSETLAHLAGDANCWRRIRSSIETK